MFLSKNQRKVLKLLRKNDNTMLYCDLHKCKSFKSDFALQSAVESLKSKEYLHYVVYKANPETLTSKSSNTEEIVLDRFEYVNDLDFSNRLLISDKGLIFLEERKHNLRGFWIPYTITTLIALGSLICSITSLVHSLR